MKDYKSIINYVERAVELLDDGRGDKVDRGHAKANLLLAIQDLKALNRQQDVEMADLIKQAMSDVR